MTATTILSLIAGVLAGITLLIVLWLSVCAYILLTPRTRWQQPRPGDL